nr:hypothetical protein [Tanacetum cinerariifolium]
MESKNDTIVADVYVLMKNETIVDDVQMENASNQDDGKAVDNVVRNHGKGVDNVMENASNQDDGKAVDNVISNHGKGVDNVIDTQILNAFMEVDPVFNPVGMDVDVEPCIAGFMKPINFTPPPTPPLHHRSPPPTSSSMIVTPSTSKPTTAKPPYAATIMENASNQDDGKAVDNVVSNHGKAVDNVVSNLLQPKIDTQILNAFMEVDPVFNPAGMDVDVE